MSLPPYLPPPAIPKANPFSRWGDHRHLAAVLDMATKVTFLTGAGLSAPSGIPTYRGTDGKWLTQDPITFGEFVRSEDKRLEQWRRTLKDYDSFGGARPNKGHVAMAELARSKDVTVITQNVDGLHGETRPALPEGRLIELHGNGKRICCLGCGAKFPFDRPMVAAAIEAGRSPECPKCDGDLMPDIVLFGANLDIDDISRARAAAEDCTVFVAVGTSLAVHPAADLVRTAVENGAVLVIAVDTVTPYHHLAHLLLAGDATEHLANAFGLLSIS